MCWTIELFLLITQLLHLARIAVSVSETRTDLLQVGLWGVTTVSIARLGGRLVKIKASCSVDQQFDKLFLNTFRQDLEGGQRFLYAGKSLVV